LGKIRRVFLFPAYCSITGHPPLPNIYGCLKEVQNEMKGSQGLAALLAAPLRAE
jgi:hypothetical protein